MMRATRSARLKRLHQALSEGLPVSLNDLIDIAGADRASVVSDLRHLRTDLGAPLRFSDGGYRYLTSYELPVLAVCLENYELQSSVESEGPELAWSALPGPPAAPIGSIGRGSARRPRGKTPRRCLLANCSAPRPGRRRGLPAARKSPLAPL